MRAGFGKLVSVTANLEGAPIDARRELSGVTELERTLDYGSFKVRDRVRLMLLSGGGQPYPVINDILQPAFVLARRNLQCSC